MTIPARVPLGDVADFINGVAFKPTDWGKSGKRILRIQNLTDPEKPFNKTNRKVAKKYEVAPGDLLVSWSATLGVFVWEGPDIALVNQHIFRVEPDSEQIDPDYLRHMLKDALVEMEKHLHGATMKHVNRREFLATTIPLPNLAEQKRIAKILDSAEALRAKRRETLAQLDTLLRSTFLDKFGDPVTNPMGWEQCTVGDVVHSAKDGPHVSPEYSENGIPFLSARHIKPGEVTWGDLKYINQDEANRQWKKCKPELGDILYTKGGTTGIAARVTTSEPFAVWVHVSLLKLIVDKVHPVWMEAMLNSAYCYTQSQRYTHGIANRDLGLKRMVKIKIYLPPLENQRQFAAIVESAEIQRAFQRAHLAELDNFFASLQSRAFRGEL